IEDQPNYQRLQIASGILNEYINSQNAAKQPLKFDDSQIHRLADKLFSYYLDQGGRNGYVDYSVLSIAEKLSPSLVDQLKKVVQGSSRRGDFGGGYDPELQKLLGNGETSADQL